MIHVLRPAATIATRMTIRRRVATIAAASLASLVCTTDLRAQVAYRVVADLASIGASLPRGGLVLGADGAYYGTTSEGGAGNCGLVYRLDTAARLSVVHEFDGADGCMPVGELTRGPDDALYGVASRGGLSNEQISSGAGTVYRMTAIGAFEILHQFEPLPPTDGDDVWPYWIPFWPYASLTLAPDGHLYGTTESADIFRISPEGEFSLVHQFTDEGEPQDLRAALVVGNDGWLYGTSPSTLTLTTSPGTIFRVSPTGDAEVVYRFEHYGRPPPGYPEFPSGGRPSGELAPGPDGEFYGVAGVGGPSETDRGVLFRLLPDGTYEMLRVFSAGEDGSYPDGAAPAGGLIIGTDGRVYGTTAAGGAHGNGTIFRMDRDGVFEVRHSFAGNELGPSKGRLLEAVPGVFYGVARGTPGGVVFELRVDGELVAEDQSVTTGAGQAVSGFLTATGTSPLTSFALVTDGSLGTAVVTDAATGAFTYTPNPGASGDDAFTFQATDGSLASNVATVTVTIEASALSVSLVWPRGGEKLFVAVPTTVYWTVSGAARVDVQLSRDGGRHYQPVPECTDLPGTTTRCVWTPMRPSGPLARLRVVATDAAGGRAADVTRRGVWIVKARPHIKIVPPIIGSVKAGRAQFVWWTHNLGARSAVRIELSRDNGASWEIVAPLVWNTTPHFGGFVWRVTGPATVKAQLRVTSLSTGASHESRRFAVFER